MDQKESLSEYWVAQSIPSEKYHCLNLVGLIPHTGRRQQLRIHLASIGHPILGDKVHAKDPLIKNVKGLQLHSYSLRFQHPFLDRELYLEAPIPKRFKRYGLNLTNQNRCLPLI